MDLAEQIAARFAWYDPNTGTDDHGRGEVMYHGTTKANLASIKAKGLLTDKNGKVWSQSGKGKVHLSRSKASAKSWAQDAAGKHFDKTGKETQAVVIKVEVQPFSTRDDYKSGVDGDQTHRGSIHPKNIKGVVHRASFNRKRHETIKKRGYSFLRSAAPKAFRFDKSNPEAISWADKHAGELINGISETTRDDIRELVAESLEGEYDVADLASQIADLLGNDARAELIARTESMTAANEGQRQLWHQAQDSGLLGKNAQREWIIGDDDKLCPICLDMEGETVGLDDDFNVDGEDIDGPPAHPNCRCTVALVV